ncbi:hypothetical protein AAMO2058_000521700 [Amorphochlora amoebiformis]
MSVFIYLGMRSQSKKDRVCDRRASSYPYHTITGNLPALRCTKEREWIPGRDIIGHLEARDKKGVDRLFDEQKRAQIVILREYLASELCVAFSCMQWKDKQNTRTTRHEWVSAAPLIVRQLGYLQLKRMFKVDQILVHNHCDTVAKAASRTIECLTTVMELCGATLESRKAYLFGSNPSTADAVLGGFLFSVFESDLPRNKLLKSILQKFPKLKRYYQFITRSHLDAHHEFPILPDEAEKDSKQLDELPIERFMKERFGIPLRLPRYNTMHTGSTVVAAVVAFHLLATYARFSLGGGKGSR